MWESIDTGLYTQMLKQFTNFGIWNFIHVFSIWISRAWRICMIVQWQGDFVQLLQWKWEQSQGPGECWIKQHTRQVISWKVLQQNSNRTFLRLTKRSSSWTQRVQLWSDEVASILQGKRAGRQTKEMNSCVLTRSKASKWALTTSNRWLRFICLEARMKHRIGRN